LWESRSPPDIIYKERHPADLVQRGGALFFVFLFLFFHNL
jgi:hypothetical protein